MSLATSVHRFAAIPDESRTLEAKLAWGDRVRIPGGTPWSRSFPAVADV